MKKLSFQFLIAKFIDLLASVSFSAFFYSFFEKSNQTSLKIIWIVLGVCLIETITALLFKFYQAPSLGEVVLGIQKNQNIRFKTLFHQIEPASYPLAQKILNAVVLAVFISAPFYTGEVFDHYSNQVTGLVSSNLKWKPFYHPEGEWKIEFPTKPAQQEKTIDLPDSKKLTLSETVSEQELLSFSIASAKLPSNLLKWSPNLILKGAMKILSSNLTSVQTSTDKIFQYRQAPTLPYTLVVEDKLIYGRLLLINDTLYKLEVECPASEKGKHQEKLEKFFNSFVPS